MACRRLHYFDLCLPSFTINYAIYRGTYIIGNIKNILISLDEYVNCVKNFKNIIKRQKYKEAENNSNTGKMYRIRSQISFLITFTSVVWQNKVVKRYSKSFTTFGLYFEFNPSIFFFSFLFRIQKRNTLQI